jgi:dTDP-4-amino-4,6-dideoxygalactose transaminase
MTDLQGAIGIEQLKKLHRFIAERNTQADYYQEQLHEVGWLSLPSKPVNGIHAWQAYVTRIEHPDSNFRNRLMAALDLDGIATRPGTHAVHLLGYYSKKYNFKPSEFPNSLIANETSMAIPLHNKLTRADQDRVIHSLKKLKD